MTTLQTLIEELRLDGCRDYYGVQWADRLSALLKADPEAQEQFTGITASCPYCGSANWHLMDSDYMQCGDCYRSKTIKDRPEAQDAEPKETR